MTHQELVQRCLAANSDLESHSRRYKVDDKHVVEFCVVGLGREIEGEPPKLHVQVSLLEHFGAEEDASEGYEEAELNQLSCATLVRFAEIKGTLDKWCTGELAELPPSTSEAPTSHRQYRRRRLMRRS